MQPTVSAPERQVAAKAYAAANEALVVTSYAALSEADWNLFQPGSA